MPTSWEAADVTSKHCCNQHLQGPIGAIIIFRQCMSHIFYKKSYSIPSKSHFFVTYLVLFSTEIFISPYIQQIPSLCNTKDTKMISKSIWVQKKHLKHARVLKKTNNNITLTKNYDGTCRPLYI